MLRLCGRLCYLSRTLCRVGRRRQVYTCCSNMLQVPSSQSSKPYVESEISSLVGIAAVLASLLAALDSFWNLARPRRSTAAPRPQTACQRSAHRVDLSRAGIESSFSRVRICLARSSAPVLPANAPDVAHLPVIHTDCLNQPSAITRRLHNHEQIARIQLAQLPEEDAERSWRLYNSANKPDSAGFGRNMY